MAITLPRMAVSVLVDFEDAVAVPSRFAYRTRPSALESAWSVMRQGTRDAGATAWILTSERLSGTLNLMR